MNEITGGKKCDVVYDSVGKDTFPGSLDCLQAARHVRQLRPVLRPDPAVQHVACWRRRARCSPRGRRCSSTIAKREDLEASAAALFDVVPSGKVEIKINQRYALKDAGKAHADLEGRRTTGTTVLDPLIIGLTPSGSKIFNVAAHFALA